MLEGIFQGIVSFLASLRSREIQLNQKTLVVLKELGEGGFSFVYLVKDKHDGSLYALKRISTQYEEQGALLAEEIAAHKQVDSPQVLKLVDSKIVVNNGRVVEGLLLLPYYQNGTAQDLVDRSTSQGGLPLSVICNLSIDICKGLEAFHACSPPRAFRDLKPANVLIGDHQRGILMDLGSVSAAQVRIKNRKDSLALQEHCAQTCTAPYRAPELFDPPSDCLITEATDICGQISFPASDKYGPPLQNLVKRILQTNPALRPSLGQIEAELSKLSSTANFAARQV
ncbi:Serine/threonine-protein kinase 16 [Kappamyces sp. JEL0829]|nr:Serine/threonine-protein kinase 16 [Kappamyces sp. JEL0829]